MLLILTSVMVKQLGFMKFNLSGIMTWCGVHDLHYGGRFFTWLNKQAGCRWVMS